MLFVRVQGNKEMRFWYHNTAQLFGGGKEPNDTVPLQRIEVRKEEQKMDFLSFLCLPERAEVFILTVMCDLTVCQKCCPIIRKVAK